MATSNVIKEVNQFEVVTVLANDSVFCRNWNLFCRRLKFPQSTMYDLEKIDKINSPISNIIFKIMDYWKSLRPAEAKLIHLSQLLREIGCAESAEHIDALFENPSSVKNRAARFHNLQLASSSKPFHSNSTSLDQLIWLNIKSPTTYYSGRENEIESIEKEWSECQNTKKMFVAITGLGGIGKSELARNYAKWFHQSCRGHCIWIDAEKSQDLLQSFVNLANKLNIPLKDESGKDKNLEVLAVEIYKTLFGKTCLLIFDNLESYDQPILKSLSDLASRQPPSVLIPFVLTTSRFRPADKFFGSKCTHIELDSLSPDAAIQFFSRYLQVDQNSDAISFSIKKLCDRLQCYPLAMQQAAAYINDSISHCLRRNNLSIKSKIEEYLDKIDIESTRLLNHQLPKLEQCEQQLENATTYLTWRITFDKIADMGPFGRGAIKLMHIISFLSPDNISSELLYKILSEIEKNSEICQENTSLEILRDHSIIYTNSHLPTISIHRLVQEVTRLKLSENGIFNYTLDQLLAGVEEMLRNNDIPSHQITHAQTIWDHASGNKQLVEKQGKFPDSICIRLYDAGKYQQLYDFSCRSLNVFEAAVGERSRLTLRVKGWKGYALQFLGEYSKSLDVQMDVYEKQKEIFVEGDYDTLWTANRIGVVHWRLNNYDEALKWYGEALQTREEIVGSGDNLTLSLKHNMASVLYKQGKYKEAMRRYKEVLQLRERVSGKEDPETLATKHNLATVRYNMKDYVGALQIFQEVLEVEERVSEADHPDTLTTKAWIADTFEPLGRMDEAFQLMKEVHEKREKVLGRTHPDTIYAKDMLERVKKCLSSPNNNSNVSKRKCAIS